MRCMTSSDRARLDCYLNYAQRGCWRRRCVVIEPDCEERWGRGSCCFSPPLLEVVVSFRLRVHKILCTVEDQPVSAVATTGAKPLVLGQMLRNLVIRRSNRPCSW